MDHIEQQRVFMSEPQTVEVSSAPASYKDKQKPQILVRQAVVNGQWVPMLWKVPRTGCLLPPEALTIFRSSYVQVHNKRRGVQTYSF